MTSGALGDAVRFLTVLPVPAGGTPRPPARALPFFPVAGLLIGAAPAALLLLPLPDAARAALALAAWVAITGALHEDGLMDCADAALAVVDRQRRLEILRDPRAGSHAVTVGTAVMLARFAALMSVTVAAPIVAAVVGRWAMALSVTLARPARPGGLGAAFAEGARLVPIVLVGASLMTALSLVAGPVRVIAAAAAGLGAAASSGWFLSRRFGGLTGDGHGAGGLLAELAALYAFLACTG